MLFLKLVIVISSLSNVGLLCRHVFSLDDSPQEKGENQNLQKSQNIISILDKYHKLNQHIDDVPRLKMQNNPEFPNFKMSTEPYTTPVNKTNLQSMAKQSRSYKNSEKRKRLSKNSTSKLKPILDKAKNKVMTLDYGRQELPSTSPQESQVEISENPRRSFNENQVKLQKVHNNLIYDESANEQNLVNKDVNDFFNTMIDNADLPQDIEKKYLLQNIILPNELIQKDKNLIGNRNVIFPEEFTELLLEQNNILKEILSKIEHSDNITEKAPYECNSTRIVHLIFDINNIGSRNFDLELNPIFKFRNEYEYGQINSDVAAAGDKNWIKVNTETNGEISPDANGPKNVLSYFTGDNYIPSQYTNPVVDVPTQTPVLNKNEPINRPWNYGFNQCRQHSVIPQNVNDFYSSTTDNKGSLTTSFYDRATVSPQQKDCKGYTYSPIPRLYSNPCNYYHNPLYTYYGLQRKNV